MNPGWLPGFIFKLIDRGEYKMSKFWKRSISLLLVVCTLVGYVVLPDAPAAKADTATDAITDLGPNLIANSTFGEKKTVTTYPECAMPANWAYGGSKVAN